MSKKKPTVESRVEAALADLLEAHRLRAEADEANLCTNHDLQMAMRNLEVKVLAYRDAIKALDQEAVRDPVVSQHVNGYHGFHGNDYISPEPEVASPVTVVGTKVSMKTDVGEISMTDAEIAMVKEQGYIPAIKAVYARTGCTLRDAKDLVESTVGKFGTTEYKS